ncbi:MAG TPA: amidohydrolase, partial [Thermoanaerobaculia bacterium]|nr:amidohydrolase [Thermoanaerobaculia bacterium]
MITANAANTALEALEADHGEMKKWFEHMHRHPELSMRERETAQYIADVAGQWGYEVATGVGTHGIVASMTVGNSGKAIGLRADFDALPIQEDNDLDYKSEV